MEHRTNHGFSLVGMLVTLLCMVVLFALLMKGMSSSITGNGNVQKDSAWSNVDKTFLGTMNTGMFVYAMEHNDRYLVPSEFANSSDTSLNTTANLFSALIMDNVTTPKQVISKNEFSGFVEEDFDYNQSVYEPRDGVYWDDNFVADLDRLSNVSFAHVPLYGERLKKHWRAHSGSRVALIGTRGPRNGEENPDSWTYGRDGTWAGHVLFGDGSVKFITTFAPPNTYFEDDGEQWEDNIFRLDLGENGTDAILSFTKEMTPGGPILQHD